MAFRRHQHLFGTTEEQLGVIAVAQREWAKLNPLAVFQDDLSIDDYMAAPYIVRPLRRPDLCMISSEQNLGYRPATVLGRSCVVRKIENSARQIW